MKTHFFNLKNIFLGFFFSSFGMLIFGAWLKLAAYFNPSIVGHREISVLEVFILLLAMLTFLFGPVIGVYRKNGKRDAFSLLVFEILFFILILWVTDLFV